MTEWEKEEILAQVLAITVDILFKNHLYSFGGNTFRQIKGGPIGLRATCAIARMVMCEWDRLWASKLNDLRIITELIMRYVDDGRIFLHPIRAGWRMVGGLLKFRKLWQLEDCGTCPTKRTVDILESTMQGVVKGLKMTVETKPDFEDQKLPTLDLSLFVTEDNRVGFTFYEKPTVSNLTIQKRSALNENSKVQSLSNEVIRRLLNTSEGASQELKGDILDKFSVKLLTSGYNKEQVGKIILGGIRGFESKRRKCIKENKPLYRTAKESGAGRLKKKLLGKSSWFRGSKGGGAKKSTLVRGGKGEKEQKGVGNTEIKTRSVIFVEQTPHGELAKRIREVLSRLEGYMGFKVKVAERSGTSIKNMFPLNSLWEGAQCGRSTCIPCTQKGEEVQNCKKRGIIYESICIKCNPDGRKKGPLKDPVTSPPSVYIGETARSLHERSREHWDSFKNGNKDSHILKHHHLHHGGEGEPEMHFKIVGLR